MRRVPFPQANNMQMILDIFLSIGHDGTSKFEVIKQCSLTDREAAYYLDALEYIGILGKQKMKYFLTEKGHYLKSLPKSIVKVEFGLIILDNKFLNELYSKREHYSDQKQYHEFIAKRIFQKESLNSVTSMRRASTVLSWFKWIDNILKKSDPHV